MRGGRASRFTVYDMMEEKGVFEENTANATSTRFKGPVEYPKMFYHPTGEKRVTQKAEVLTTPLGPVKVGELYEIIHKMAAGPEEEDELRAAGWHDHPAKAIAAGGGEAPPITSQQRVEDLEAQIKRLTAELASAKSVPVKAEAAD